MSDSILILSQTQGNQGPQGWDILVTLKETKYAFKFKYIEAHWIVYRVEKLGMKNKKNYLVNSNYVVLYHREWDHWNYKKL